MHRSSRHSNSSADSEHHHIQTNVPGYDAMIQHKTPPGGPGVRDYKEFATPKLSVLKTKPQRYELKHQKRNIFGSTSSQDIPVPKCASAPSTPSKHTPEQPHTDVLDSGDCVSTGNIQNSAHISDFESVNQQETLDYSSQFAQGGVPAPNTSQPYPGYVGYERQPEPPVSHSLPEQLNQLHISQQAPFDSRTTMYSQNNVHGLQNPNMNTIQNSGFYPAHLYRTSTPVTGFTGTATFPVASHLPTAKQMQNQTGNPGYQFTSTPMSATMPQVPLQLLDWQIQQQQQLRRQQLDATKNMYAPSVATPSFLEATSGSSDPHKWDSLKRVTDNIVKEKDMIIDRQKLKIQQFEYRLTEMDSQLKHLLRLRADEAGDKIAIKFQEAQYDNASLNAKLIDLEADRKQQVEELRSQLGATEYDLEKIQRSLNNDISAKSEEINKNKEKVEEQEATIAEWKRKHSELKESYTASKKKVKSLERYLMDLPSPHEYSETNRRLATLEVDYSVSQTSLQDIDSALKEANRQIITKDSQIDQLENQERELVARFQKMEVEVDDLKEKLKERTMSVVEQENEMLKSENKRLSLDIENAKQMLDAQHKKIKQLEACHQTDMSNMQDRLGEEEAMTQALREEIQLKEEEMLQVRGSMKQIVDQNQDLMETSLVMKDKCRELEKMMSAEHHQLEQRLYHDLTSCFNDLQALVNVCMQQAEGHEPNMSVLLGVRAPPAAEFGEQEGLVASQTLKMRLSRVQDLQKEIDKLRQVISNKYAEDMGANISCATQ